MNPLVLLPGQPLRDEPEGETGSEKPPAELKNNARGHEDENTSPILATLVKKREARSWHRLAQHAAGARIMAQPMNWKIRRRCGFVNFSSSRFAM
ncbi:MAG: hypothetical protein ACK6DG_00210 [Cyanobacteriota bacterium]|jgi:hypothetical protein